MFKAYAKEYPVEYVEDVFEWNDYYEQIYVEGNRNFAKHVPEELKKLLAVLDAGELAEALDDIERRTGGYYCEWYKNATEAITDFIDVPHKPGKRPATKTISRIKKAILYYANGLLTKAEALTELTGRRYEETTIRGCCQGDYARVIYPADEYPNGLKYFEADFFGMFTEYEVHDGENAPDGADDISGYFMRVYDDPEKEIAEECGCKPEEVKIFRFGGYKKTAYWEA